MSEEAKTTEQEPRETKTQEPENKQPEPKGNQNPVSGQANMDQLAYIATMAERNPSLMDDENVRKKVEQYNQLTNSEGSENNNETKTETKPTENTATSEGETKEADNNRENKEGSEGDSKEGEKKGKGNKKSLFLKDDGSDSEDGEELDADTFVQKVSEEFGMKGDRFEDLAGKFLNSSKKWRKDSQKLSETEKELEGIQGYLKELPSPLKAAMIAYNNGEDFNSAYEQYNTPIDFQKEADDYDKEDLIEYYMKDRYQKLEERKDELDEEEYEERLNDYHYSAKELYERDRQKLEQERADIEKKEEERIEALKNSVVSSVETLKNKYPDFKGSEDYNKQLQTVQNLLVNGGVQSILYNEDGTFKDDAAEKVWFMKFGEEEMKNLAEIAENRGETKANLEHVAAGPKRPTTKGKGERQLSSQEQILAEQAERMKQTSVYDQ